MAAAAHHAPESTRRPGAFDVDAALRATVATNDALALLPAYRVVYRADIDAVKDSHVSLIAGGGSGHEPAHVGFVGGAMLSAAVCGDVFASPSAAQVEAAIGRVGGRAGVLLVVKNYTGDRLNFGLAAERVRRTGANVRMLVVDDDCALPTAHRSTGRRGLAGTVLVHKVLGHHAAAGMPLDDLLALGETLVKRMGTAGMSMDEHDKAVLGRGIHGEPGARTLPHRPDMRETAQLLVETVLRGAVPLVVEHPVAVLINNLGAASDGAVAELLDAVVMRLQEQEGVEVRVAVAGRLMTSLIMQGVSLTLLTLGDARFEPALLSAVPTTAWPGASLLQPPTSPPAAAKKRKASRREPISSDGNQRWVMSAVVEAAEAIVKAAKDLDKLDEQIGDGDCGTTMRAMAEALLARFRLDSTEDTIATFGDLLDDIAETLDAAPLVGGSSGALYQIGLTAAAAAVAGKCELVPSAETVQTAIRAATGAIQRYGGAARGDRTMLDALLPLLGLPDFRPEHVAGAAWLGARNTAPLPARAGRASYVQPELLQGVPDPGAIAVATWVQALADCVANKLK